MIVAECNRVMELQNKNNKLQKQIREKIDRINGMDAKIEVL